MSELRDLVLRRDQRALPVAAARGTDAVAELGALLGHEDWRVREVAALALGAIRDPATLDLLFGALADPQSVVAGSALAAIVTFGDPGGARVLTAFDASTDARVREGLAAVLIRTRDVDAPAIAERLAREGRRAVQSALLAALAARGDVPAQREMAERLLATRGLERLRWVQLAEASRCAALVPALRALLSDREGVIYLGGPPGGPEELRICDVALVAIVVVAKVPFEGVPAPLFSDAQIEAVRGAVPDAPDPARALTRSVAHVAQPR